jgi:hypothetical protein
MILKPVILDKKIFAQKIKFDFFSFKMDFRDVSFFLFLVSDQRHILYV